MNQIYYVGYDAIHPDNFIYDVPEGFHNFLLIITTTPLYSILVKPFPNIPPTHASYILPVVRFGTGRLAVLTEITGCVLPRMNPL